MRKGFVGAVGAAVVAVVAGFAPVASANVIVNGGFETGALSPWFNGRRFNSGGGSTPWSVTNSTSSSGSYSAVTSFRNTELRQNFSGISAASIRQVSFYLEDEASNNAYDFFYSDGTDDEFIISGSNGTSFTFFDVTSNLDTSKTLTGFSVFGNIESTTYLDDVVITSGVPEPSTWAMMALGLGGLGFLACRKRKDDASAAMVPA